MSDSAYTADPPQYEDKAWLYEQYWGQLRSLTEIAEECDVTYATVGHWMTKLGIPRRSQAAAQWDNPLADYQWPDDQDGVDWAAMGGDA